jgi:uncharacterized protein YndB with AHSA1/START domain
MLHVCPTDVIHAPVDRIWHLIATPRELAAWSGTTLVEGPEREVAPGDRIVLGAGIANRLRVIFDVREVVPPQRLSFHIRLPFGVTNDETIQISPVGANESRVTYN